MLEYQDYQENDKIYKPLSWQLKNLQQTASGYGDKLATTWMLKVGNRIYRIYLSIHSNIGTCYIIKHGKRYIVR